MLGGGYKNIKKCFAAAILIVFCLTATNVFAAAAVVNRDAPKTPDVERSGVEVDDIYIACKYYFSKLFNTRENVSRKNICNGYFFGSASILLLLQSEGVVTDTCMPMDISTEEVIKSFLDWAGSNPDKMKMLASEALLELVRQKYPCMAYKGKPDSKPKQKN